MVNQSGRSDGGRGLLVPHTPPSLADPSPVSLVSSSFSHISPALLRVSVPPFHESGYEVSVIEMKRL